MEKASFYIERDKSLEAMEIFHKKAATDFFYPHFIDDQAIFTERHIQIIDLHYDGLTNQEIAEELGVARKTINNHNSQILARARKYFDPSLKSAKEVAYYLDYINLI